MSSIALIRNHASLGLFLSARAALAPLWQTTSLWNDAIPDCNDPKNSAAYKAAAVAKASFCTLALAPFTLSGLVVGQVLHLAGYAIAPAPYIHLKGGRKPVEQTNNETTIFQLNCGLTDGGFARRFVGTKDPDSTRVTLIANKILRQKPDHVSLQEVSSLKSAFTLYCKLYREYDDFIIHAGASRCVVFNGSGLFNASKGAMTNIHFESFAGIDGIEGAVNKGSLGFSVDFSVGPLKEGINIINTHQSPTPGSSKKPADEPGGVRFQEQHRVQVLAEKLRTKNEKAVICTGDFNTKTGPLFTAGKKTPDDNLAACNTGYLVSCNLHHKPSYSPNSEYIDYAISLFGASTTTTIEENTPLCHPEKALSDHPTLIHTIS